MRLNNSIIGKQRIKIYLIHADVFPFTSGWKSFSKILEQFVPRSIKTIYTWVTVLKSNIYRSICMGKDFVCKPLHTRNLRYNFCLYPVGFFFPSKLLKLIYQCSRELIMSFLTGRSYVQICCKENLFGALVRAPCCLSIFWHFFSKRNTEIKYFQKYVPHGVPWGMCYLTATYSLAYVFF